MWMGMNVKFGLWKNPPAHLHDLHNGDQVGQWEVISCDEGPVLDKLFFDELQWVIQILQGCVQLVLWDFHAQNFGNQKLQAKEENEKVYNRNISVHTAAEEWKQQENSGSNNTGLRSHL